MTLLHHTRRYALIRQVIVDALGPHPRLLSRRRMAAFLRSLADELERSGKGHGHGGPAGQGLRWNGNDLLLGKALWRAIGCPRHVSFLFDAEHTGIRANEDGEYKVRIGRKGVPRIGCIRIAQQGEWAVGWRPGEVRGRTIWFAADVLRP